MLKHNLNQIINTLRKLDLISDTKKRLFLTEKLLSHHQKTIQTLNPQLLKDLNERLFNKSPLYGQDYDTTPYTPPKPPKAPPPPFNEH